MFHIIINTASKSGKGHSPWKDLKEVLDAHGATYEVHATGKKGDATEYARMLTGTGEKIKLLVCGGDGTLNEVLQGIENFENTSLYYVPTGSGNDFARDFKGKGSPVKRLNRILENPVEQLIDVGVADIVTDAEEKKQYRFGVSCGIGFDAAVCEKVEHSRAKAVLNKIGLGKVVYLVVAIGQILSSKKVACRVTIGKNEIETYRKLLFATGMMHRYEGGGFMFCPKADGADGLADLCAVHDISKAKVLSILPTAFKGKHVLFHKNVRTACSESFLVEVDEPMFFHTDGEVQAKAKSVRVSCLKQALHLYI